MKSVGVDFPIPVLSEKMLIGAKNMLCPFSLPHIFAPRALHISKVSMVLWCRCQCVQVCEPDHGSQRNCSQCANHGIREYGRYLSNRLRTPTIWIETVNLMIRACKPAVNLSLIFLA